MTKDNDPGEPNKLLGHLKAVDFGLGLAGGLVGNMLKDLGVVFHRAEPAGGDPFYAVHPAYRVWQAGKSIIRTDSVESALDQLQGRLAEADLCIVGGEAYPGLDWRPDVERIAKDFPRLIILEIGGGQHGTPNAGLPAVELMVQAQAGLVFEQLDDRPTMYAFPAASFGAAFQGLIGVAAALYDRERTGQGQIVRTSLFEGAMAWLGHDWFAFEKDVAVAKDVTPKGARPLIFRCVDDTYIHIILASTDSRKHLYTVLGVETPVPSLEEDPRGMPSNTRPAANYYDDVDKLQSYVSYWTRTALLDALWKKGVSAETVTAPGECWSDKQTIFNGTITKEADGTRRVGLPFKLRPGPAIPPAFETPDSRDATAPPLQGMKVVDFGAFTAGPHASVALSDLGADVIRVEALTGDVFRFYKLKFTASNRGKRVIAIDMKQPEGLDLALKLCAGADVVHHNFRPGVTKRLGIDVESLHALKPELILLESAAYGLEGPKAESAGFDMIFHSFCGHSVRGVTPGATPRNYRLPVVDFSAGLVGSISLLLASYLCRRGARGATMSSSLLETGTYLLSELLGKPDGGFFELPDLNASETGFYPWYRLYAAKGGWLAVAALDDAMAERLLDVLGLRDRITRPRRDWDEDQAVLIAQAFAAMDLLSALERLRRADVWASACNVEAKLEILGNETLQRQGSVVTAVDPDLGRFRQMGIQFSLSRSKTRVLGKPPARGEHTREILVGLGLSDEKIDSLYSRKIVA
jgi:crotonobetainyl-CoA:carnitine CoA-transferase CaiB-like acyl-CoA transferase